MRTLHLILVFSVLGLAPNLAHGRGAPEFRVARASVAPEIDGDLGDEVWTRAPLDLAPWISYNPLRGARTDLRTDVRVAYDDDFIYFAFHCFDAEPKRIRTTISDRGNVFSDDWMALSLDSASTGPASPRVGRSGPSTSILGKSKSSGSDAYSPFTSTGGGAIRFRTATNGSF